MNARQLISSTKALAATALLALAGAAQAGGVHWTVGVDAPIHGPGRVQAVVSNGQRYHAPQPVVYVQPAPVYYAPRPMPVVYEAPRFRGGWGHDRWHQHHHRHGRAEAYRRGYERGYDHGHGRDGGRDDRRGGWDRHHH